MLQIVNHVCLTKTKGQIKSSMRRLNYKNVFFCFLSKLHKLLCNLRFCRYFNNNIFCANYNILYIGAIFNYI